MKRIIFALLALALAAPSYAGNGYCPPFYGGHKPYVAPAYKAPVHYHAPHYAQPLYVPVVIPYPVAEQGKSLYGYQSHSISAFVNKGIDAALITEGLVRSLQAAQQTADNIGGDLNSTLKLAIEGNNSLAEANARVAELDAKVRLLKAAEPPAGSGALRLKLLGESRQRVEVESDADAPSDEPSDIADVLTAKCLKCHSGKEAKAGLDLSKFVAFSADKKEFVLSHLEADPPDNRPHMPPKDEPQLSYKELKAFLCD